MALRGLPSSAEGGDQVRSVLKTTDGRPELIVLRNESDLTIRPDLATVLARVLTGHRDVIIDLAETDFIDTDTFFTMAAAARLLHRDGRRITFRSPSRLATRVLNLYGLGHLIAPG
jgi:anti-anti-sigma regulatory factor